ncbi:hypothetical protein QYE76_026009 [Lolium multiflorum]|uniref:F-box domain-containing protein n=1 Tax=Lolium multiflorum TaxID=4521 RepID=A0AAD8VUR3_LOLMU|nr:hypothetical protein QYE76_026009 [Lolium multiflorum]
MPDRRGTTLLEDLPEEIIDNILVRLASKDVGRCRAVSTSWLSATSTPEFMLQHHRRQPSLPLIYGRQISMLVAFGAGALWPFLPDTKHRHEIHFRGACDGLLAVSRGSRSYVCNPVIRARVLLPQPQSCQDVTMGFAGIIGFYRHHPTGEHRVLWGVSQDYYKYSLYILTVGCDKPRHVEVRLPTTSEPVTIEHKLLAVLCGSNYFPVVDHGNLLSRLRMPRQRPWPPLQAQLAEARVELAAASAVAKANLEAELAVPMTRQLATMADAIIDDMDDEDEHDIDFLPYDGEEGAFMRAEQRALLSSF